MASQTAESGRRSGIWGRAIAQRVAKAIGAKINQANGRSQRSNSCLFQGKPAAIKTASLGNQTFLIYETLLRVTEVTLFAAQSSLNNFKVYQLPSAAIRHVGRPASHPIHSDRAHTISLAAVKAHGIFIRTVRIPLSMLVNTDVKSKKTRSR
jgi:hypothetical protein